MTLKSENKIHSVILKLDKEVPRELALRQFLDDATDKGINRKEAILRIFESYSNTDPFSLEPNRQSRTEAEIIMDDTEDMLGEIKADREVKSAAEFE